MVWRASPLRVNTQTLSRKLQVHSWTVALINDTHTIVHEAKMEVLVESCYQASVSLADKLVSHKIIIMAFNRGTLIKFYVYWIVCLRLYFVTSRRSVLSVESFVNDEHAAQTDPNSFDINVGLMIIQGVGGDTSHLTQTLLFAIVWKV